MFKDLLGKNPEATSGLASVSSSNVKMNAEGGGHTIIDKGNYTVITVSKPDSVYLNKDTPGNGIDYFKGDEIVVNGPLFKNDGTPVGGFFQNGKCGNNRL